MQKENVQELIDMKKEHQSKLIDVLKKYYMRFVEKLFEKSLRKFQEKLLDISNWSDEKINKEYNKFLIFVEDKYELHEDDIEKLLYTVYVLNIKIMTLMYDEIDINVPKLKKFWYKLFKRIAKFYYEHPKVVLSNNEFKNTKTNIAECINHTLQQFIPLKEIMHVKQKTQDKYNFDDGLGNTSHNISEEGYDNSTHSFSDKTESTSESNSNNSEHLKYISSQEFDNEYYMSDEEHKNNNKIEKSEEKHIKMPKYIFPHKKRKNVPLTNKPAKNEIDEHFFDDL